MNEIKSLYFSAIEEAKNFISNNEHLGMVLFSEPKYITELSKYANNRIVLCSSAGEFSHKGFTEHSITGFSFDVNEADIVEIIKPSIRSIHALKKSYDKVKHNPNAFLFLLCDGLSMGEESILSTLFFIKNDFKIIGGSAGDYCSFSDTLIYIGNRRVYSVGIFFNIQKRTQLIKENIYHTTQKRLLVTKADPLKRIVYELNGGKAATEYAKALGIPEGKLSETFFNYPLGRVVQDQTFIASPMKVNPDKSITFYSQILPNSFIEVLKPNDIIENVQDTLGEIQFQPDFILSIHCVLRSFKLKDSNLWPAFQTKLLSVTPNQAGFISYGEQFYKRHLNQTMVILVLEK